MTGFRATFYVGKGFQGTIYRFLPVFEVKPRGKSYLLSVLEGKTDSVFS
jgi:hypothetical protein